MAFVFEKLDVYQRSVDFADEVIALTNTFPSREVVMANQLKRAAISITLNIAEGCGRWHQADKKRFFTISRGSAFECVAAAEICRRRAYIGEAEYAEIRANLERLCQMLTKLIKLDA